MELLDGCDLQRLVGAEGSQPLPRALHILKQLSDALVEAHAVGLVHRDIKPANVMLCTRGGIDDFVKVLDFGLVKDLNERARRSIAQEPGTHNDFGHLAKPDTLRVTAENKIAGTPHYLAPESILAPETVGPAADVYAVGCVAHFLVTGRPPFVGTTIVEVCIGHVHTPPAAPSSFSAEALPEAFDRLVLACLQKDPATRPTMRALSEQLSALEKA